MRIIFFAPLLVLALISSWPIRAQDQQQKVSAMEEAFIGTYTKKEGHVDGQADGILHLKIDRNSGKVMELQTAAEIVNPSFVKLSPNGKFLFAVSELGPGDAEAGYIYSFKTTEDGQLKEISRLSTEAYAPAHIEVDKSGQFVFVSNYLGGVVMMYGVNPDGSLERLQQIQLENPDQSHAHSLTLSPENKTVYIADLGNDRIWIFKLDTEKARLIKADQPFVALEDGTGPRHLTISANGEVAYSVNELNNSISVFKVFSTGGLKEVQNISTLPTEFSEKNSAADIWLHPSGEWLYASNRGHNSIVTYKIDRNTGRLQLKGFTSTEGRTPRGFSIAPDGKMMYVANQDSGNISVFTIDDAGNLILKDEPSEVPTPVRIELVK